MPGGCRHATASQQIDTGPAQPSHFLGPTAVPSEGAGGASPKTPCHFVVSSSVGQGVVADRPQAQQLPRLHRPYPDYLPPFLRTRIRGAARIPPDNEKEMLLLWGLLYGGFSNERKFSSFGRVK
jgi:hypothetical protein